MRIIGGLKRGTNLYTMTTEETRPTLDQVKEAVFSMIATQVYQSKILDLYSGSGAIGLECLSRGAAFGVFVDANPESIKIIEKNIDKLQFGSTALVLPLTDVKAIELVSRKGLKFDIIYLDPPFGRIDINAIIAYALELDLLSPGGLIIVEEDYSKRIELTNQTLVVYKDKRYGRISIRILRREE